MEHKNKLMYDNQAVLNVEIKDLQKEKFDLYSKYQRPRKKLKLLNPMKLA
jgi:hypothetical protein